MSWQLAYQTMEMALHFEKPVVFNRHPVFYFRSLLGKELFYLICPFRSRMCERCTLRFKCAYSFVFESPVTRDNPVLYGRNFASHPFVMSSDVGEKQSTERLNLKMILIGQAAEYIPIIFWSFIRAGETGIFKNRVRYKIDELKINGQPSFKDEKLNLPGGQYHWRLSEEETTKRGQLFLEFLTPFRFKKDGRYLKEMSVEDVLQAAKRRMEILVGTYGAQDFVRMPFPQMEAFSENAQMRWKDYVRWSARQKQQMRLGGVVGILSVEGQFSAMALSLLKGAEIFHVGKNTSFGLGKIKVTFVEGEVHG